MSSVIAAQFAPGTIRLAERTTPEDSLPSVNGSRKIGRGSAAQADKRRLFDDGGRLCGCDVQVVGVGPVVPSGGDLLSVTGVKSFTSEPWEKSTVECFPGPVDLVPEVCDSHECSA